MLVNFKNYIQDETIDPPKKTFPSSKAPKSLNMELKTHTFCPVLPDKGPCPRLPYKRTDVPRDPDLVLLILEKVPKMSLANFTNNI